MRAIRSFMRAVISPLCRVTNPAPLLHHEPLAFIVREIELPRSFGRPLIRRLDVAAILQPRTQDRHALGAELVGGGGLLDIFGGVGMVDRGRTAASAALSSGA